MKKIMYGLLIFIVCISLYAANKLVDKQWSAPTTMAAGSTNLVSGVTGKRILLKNVIFTVQNACYLYFYSGTAPAGTAISNKFNFGANGGFTSLDGDELEFLTASGAALGVWTSADPSSDIVFEYQVID